MKKEPNAFAVADYIIKESKRKKVTFIRVKVLLYLTYVYHMLRYGESLYRAVFIQDGICPVDFGFQNMDRKKMDRIYLKRKALKSLKGVVTLDKRRMKSVRTVVGAFEGGRTYDITSMIHGQARLLGSSMGYEEPTMKTIVEQEKESFRTALDRAVLEGNV